MPLPPHSAYKNWRLSCQTKVLGNVRVTKFDGCFGEGEYSIWTPKQGLAEAPAIASALRVVQLIG